MAQRYPIERVAAGIVFVWGICLICTTACHNWQALYAQRFFLGILESGISPVLMLVVGGWYKKAEQAFRMGHVRLHLRMTSLLTVTALGIAAQATCLRSHRSSTMA